jgi:hypothetical protein
MGAFESSSSQLEGRPGIVGGYWLEAVKEWRDARQALFDTPVNMNVTPAQFARLAVAEGKLMDLARGL